jgi:hypothetical protein
MARTWLEIRVVLEGGGGIDLRPPPGRTMIVGPGHSFEQLVVAINAAFARWDLSHLHEFRLADGRRSGFPKEDFDDPLWDFALHRAAARGRHAMRQLIEGRPAAVHTLLEASRSSIVIFGPTQPTWLLPDLTSTLFASSAVEEWARRTERVAFGSGRCA